jgi:hypothetical protein
VILIVAANIDAIYDADGQSGDVTTSPLMDFDLFSALYMLVDLCNVLVYSLEGSNVFYYPLSASLLVIHNSRDAPRVLVDTPSVPIFCCFLPQRCQRAY